MVTGTWSSCRAFPWKDARNRALAVREIGGLDSRRDRKEVRHSGQSAPTGMRTEAATEGHRCPLRKRGRGRDRKFLPVN